MQISVTFDPFMSLSVPIPKNLRHLPVIFVPKDPDSMPQEVSSPIPVPQTWDTKYIGGGGGGMKTYTLEH